MHTNASDGTNTVRERARQAKKNQIDTIAITDHDTINDILEPGSQTIDGVEVITGAEIKCEIENTGIEILGYYLDPQDESINQLFEEMNENRETKIDEMIQRINEGENLDITLEEVQNSADGPLGRPHLARTIVNKDLAANENETFNKYLDEDLDKNYYVPTQKLGADKVIKKIHENGGVTSLAHPGRDLPYNKAEQIIEKLVENGLDGIETEYTYQHKIEDGYNIKFANHYKKQGINKPEQITQEIQQEINKLAEKYNLIKTGGSDCHGKNTGKYNIGKIKLQDEQIQKIRDKTNRDI